MSNPVGESVANISQLNSSNQYIAVNTTNDAGEVSNITDAARVDRARTNNPINGINQGEVQSGNIFSRFLRDKPLQILATAACLIVFIAMVLYIIDNQPANIQETGPTESPGTRSTNLIATCKASGQGLMKNKDVTVTLTAPWMSEAVIAFAILFWIGTVLITIASWRRWYKTPKYKDILLWIIGITIVFGLIAAIEGLKEITSTECVERVGRLFNILGYHGYHTTDLTITDQNGMYYTPPILSFLGIIVLCIFGYKIYHEKPDHLASVAIQP
jgi:TRAP-type C4-dicarboxylate transport system permease small subunit